jgi:hypothetical protein
MGGPAPGVTALVTSWYSPRSSEHGSRKVRRSPAPLSIVFG